MSFRTKGVCLSRSTSTERSSAIWLLELGSRAGLAGIGVVQALGMVRHNGILALYGDNYMPVKDFCFNRFHEDGLEIRNLNAVHHTRLRAVENELSNLRHHYDLAQYDAIARSARAGFLAQTAVWSAGVLAVALFLAYLVMVRTWLIRPIGELMRSADAIGAGDLDHRVALTGANELAELGRKKPEKVLRRKMQGCDRYAPTLFLPDDYLDEPEEVAALQKHLAECRAKRS